MGEEWDAHAETWDEGGPVVYADAAAASLRRQAKAFALPLAGARLLDFGCGTGLLCERLSGEADHVVALDPSAAMLAHLRSKVGAGLARVEPIEGYLDATTLDTNAFAEPFDLIVASSVCAFLDDYPGTLARLSSLLRPGGAFVQWDWEWRAEDEEPFGLSREAVTEALGRAGLEILLVDRGFDVPFGEMMMSPLMGIGRKVA